MQPVTVFLKDIADVADTNRISVHAESAFETLLESITQGKRSLLWGGVPPIIFAQAAPDITIRVPQQYYAIEARSALFALTDMVITHPNPGTDHDFYIYLMLRLADQAEDRDNVDTGTFAVTPTSRITHKLEETEFSVLNVATPGGQPFPATGVGVPAAGFERLGFVEIVRFTWDGTAAVPTLIFNAADVISLGSAGMPLHGPTHVTSDPIPHADNVNRGVLAKRSQSYVKASLIRVEVASGEPFTISPIGDNGPPGDYTFDIFNPSTAKGVEISLLMDGSLEVVAAELKVKYGGPAGGVAGSSLLAAREDHEHLILATDQTFFKHDDVGYSETDATVAVYTAVPTGSSALPSLGAVGEIVLLQIDLFATGPDVADPLNALQFRITGGGGMERWVTVAAGGSGDRVAQSTMVMIELDGSGTVNIVGFNAGTAKYRLSVLGTFGQGS